MLGQFARCGIQDQCAAIARWRNEIGCICAGDGTAYRAGKPAFVELPLARAGNRAPPDEAIRFGDMPGEYRFRHG